MGDLGLSHPCLLNNRRKFHGMLKNTSGPLGESLATKAAKHGDIEFFRGVVRCLKENLTSVEMQDMFMADSGDRDPLLVVAARREDMDLVRDIIVCLREHLTSEQVQELFLGKNAVRGRGHNLVEVMRRFNNEMFTVVIGFLPEVLTSEQVRELALTKTNGQCLLALAFERKDLVSLGKVLTCFNDAGPWEDNQAAKRLDLDAIFSSLAKLSLPPGDEFRCVAMEILSYFLANYARPTPGDLIKLSRYARQASDELFNVCCMRGVTSAANPFISGMILSVALLQAAEKAPEGEQAGLILLQKNVDNLLLEIFERLPQTVGGFDGGMDGCSAVFESEWARSTDSRTETLGPLNFALEERQQRETFCNVPLVMDFLSRQFSHGLPDLRDTGGVLSNRDELKELDRGSKRVRLIVGQSDGEKIDKKRLIQPELGDNEDNKAWEHFTLLGRRSILPSLMSPGALLQGANDRFPSLTFLPGVQFISAGLAAKPSHYYRVPAMRMVLDFVVYLGMLALFIGVVLYPEDGAPSVREYVLMFYLVAAWQREVHEMSRGIFLYFEDRWNAFDVLGLVLLSAGLIFRHADSSSHWGQDLYSLSAPLLFSRVLFFAQILPFQGPMINVIFSMTAELVRFGIVMVVIMIGFAVSFHALLRSSDSFDETMFNLFQAMLGEVGFFDELSGSQNNPVATILLVVYLIIITVMLLNLLVAILSTSHANVQENVEREFRVSKARMIQHYRLVVHKHLLPAPFNLVQQVVSLALRVVDSVRGCNTRTLANEVAGQVAFWLTLGPIAVTQGALLWMTSVVYSTVVWRKHYSESTKLAQLQALKHGDSCRRYELKNEENGRSRMMFMALAQFCSCIWCLVGAPLYLFALWLRLPSVFRFFVRAVHRVRRPFIDTNFSPGTPPVAPTENAIPTEERLTVDQMLKNPAGGVGAEDVRRYLDDPMVNDKVREDERKTGATVEHVKLLRNRLENTLATDMQLKNLSNECLENKQQIAENSNKLNEVLSILKAIQNLPAETAT